MASPTTKTERITVSPKNPSAPDPDTERPRWQRALAGFLGENPEQEWGGRLIKAASDMIVVCDGELNILFHNRAFLRSSGHVKGSYIGHSLMDFIPSNDKAEASRVFDQFLHGRAAGMRVEATFLTRSGRRKVEARVTRTARTEERYFLYFIIRDAFDRNTETEQLTKRAVDSVFDGLPIAAFRTDHQLRITDTFGSYWDELGLNARNFTGAELSNPGCTIAPQFFHQLDYCDVMAGQTFHTSIFWRGNDLEITIEPFIDRSRGGRVIGTLGTIREAKNATPNGASHLSYPKPEEYTHRQSLTGAHARSVALTASPAQPKRPGGPKPKSQDAISPELAKLRSSIRPRPLRPAHEDATADEVALAN